MTLITNDNALRKYIPNAFSTAKGEMPLFDKLAPWLATSEQWLTEKICGENTLAKIVALDDMNVVKMLASQIVVSDALRRAIPSLDLVLTPNGFGIVSNTNVAPASKERVERLIKSLLDNRDNCIEQLITQLCRFPDWKVTEQCRWFTTTLFHNLDLVTLCGITEHRWEKYTELRSKVLAIEDTLAEEYFSHEFMQVLRSEAVADVPNGNRAWIVARMKPQIVDFIHDKPINRCKMIDIVNFIRNNPEEFPEWHNSDTAKLFSPPIFENKKSNKGYWF